MSSNSSSEFRTMKKRKGKEIESVAVDVTTDSNANQNESKKLKMKKWSDEDIVVLLQGAIRYIQENGMQPNDNLQNFCNFVSTSLQGDFNKSQISEKLRRLKKNYLNNCKNEKSLSTHHQRVVFDLSNSIWKQQYFVETQGVDSNITARIVEFVRSSILDYGEDLMKKYAHLVPSEKKEELDKKWLKVAKVELELLVTKYDIINEEARVLKEALNSNHGD